MRKRSGALEGGSVYGMMSMGSTVLARIGLTGCVKKFRVCNRVCNSVYNNPFTISRRVLTGRRSKFQGVLRQFLTCKTRQHASLANTVMGRCICGIQWKAVHKKSGSGRWSVNIILLMGRLLGNKVVGGVRTGAEMVPGEYSGRRSENRKWEGSWKCQIMLSIWRYPVSTVPWNTMKWEKRRGSERCNVNTVNEKVSVK